MSAHPESRPPVRPLAENPVLLERAAELIRLPPTMMPLTPTEAMLVASQMAVVDFPAGATLLREGEASRAAYLLLVLDGQVQVDSQGGGRADAVALSVLGPGSIVGEMALLDGAPRSASCTALGPVRAAGLSRKGLERLIEAHPEVACRLLMGLAQRIADRLRGLGAQVQMYAQLTVEQQAEIERLRAGMR
jgi:CRP-like cAMP-binding protein